MKVKSITMRGRTGAVLQRHEMVPAPVPPPPALHGNKSHSGAPGLGDVVEKLAKPIARLIDRVAGTRLATCGACARRRKLLNRLVPDVRRPLQRKERER